MTHLLGYLLVFGLLALSPMATAGPGGGKPGEIIIRAEGGMLTVQARDVSHRRILEGMAKQLNIELVVAGPLEERRSLEIDHRPWEEALKKALSPASWAFVYDASGGEPRLAKIFVFPSKSDSPGSGPGSGRPSSTPDRVADPASALLPAPNRQARQAPQRAEQSADTSVSAAPEAEDAEARALALVGLATTGGEQAIVALRQALQDREPWIRETAVEALAEIGGEQAMQGLQQALHDENEDVRKAAQEALIRLQPNPQ
jgi:HEAT repeats